MVYISTDYVFSGECPPYSADAQPGPVNAYGRLKLDGEVKTLSADENNLVLRVPILYGEVASTFESGAIVAFSLALRSNHRGR